MEVDIGSLKPALPDQAMAVGHICQARSLSSQAEVVLLTYLKNQPLHCISDGSLISSLKPAARREQASWGEGGLVRLMLYGP